MMRVWRRLALAAAFYLTVSVGVVAAQSVVVTNAPPKSRIELVLNLATVGSATADPAGDATLALNLPANLKKQEADVNIYVDVCADARRVFLVERGVQPAATAPGCERHEVPGLFVVRQVTSLVVDVAAARPAVWLKQGPVPKQWLLKGAAAEEQPRNWRPAPVGLVVFGGGGVVGFGTTGANFCGDVVDCKNDSTGRAYTAGVEWWLTRYLAAEAAFVQPSKVTGVGSGDTYSFDSSLETRIFTFAGKVGIPIGPARIYGKAGMDYVRSTSNTSETTIDTAVQIDDVVQVIPGGKQTWQVKTTGWGLMFGGGAEGWLTRWLAIYGEGGWMKVKGNPEGGGEAKLNDRALYIVGGIRLHIGK